MKKLMVALGAAVVCGAVLADSAVESGTVGYTTATIQGTDAGGNLKWHLLAIQFKGVGSANDQISISDALKMTSVPAYAGAWKNKAANAPTLQVWDGAAFVPYYYVAPACSGLANDAWVTGTTKADVGPTTMLKPGDAIWFNAKNLGVDTGVITFAGEVKNSASATVSIGAQTWSMGSNPYPATYSINRIVPSFPAYAGAWKNKAANAPTLQIWDGAAFVPYYYVAPACSGLSENAWVTGTTKAATTDTLDPGAGFWFRNVNGEAGTLTFTME